MIVDSHVHVVSGDRDRYKVLPDAPDWPVTEVEGLVRDMDALGIERALLVQTFFTYGTDNSYMIDSAARYPGRFQTVAMIDQVAKNAPDVLTELVMKHGVAGLRFMPKACCGIRRPSRCGNAPASSAFRSLSPRSCRTCRACPSSSSASRK
jgi:predicted TIM-barrel fold metal-dependent hydrolase